MNTFMHGPSFFSFNFLSFSISFPRSISHFYYFTSLHGLQDVENPTSPLSPCIILYIIGLEGMK